MIEIYLAVKVVRDGMECYTRNLKAFGLEKDAIVYKEKYTEYLTKANVMISEAKEFLDTMTEENQHDNDYKFPMDIMSKYGLSVVDFEIEIEKIDLVGVKRTDDKCNCVECDGRGSNCKVM